MGSQLFFRLNDIRSEKNEGGRATRVTSKEMPGLVNISFEELRLNQNGFQEPIWHPNAGKIGYCTKGSALVSMRTPGNVEVFTVEAGDVFFIPKGYVHAISNIGKDESVINFALNDTNPQTMLISKALSSLSETVFTANFKSPPDFIKTLKASQDFDMIKTIPFDRKPLQSAPNRFKFNIAKSVKTIQTAGGYLQVATKPNLPVLEGLGILGFGLNPKGIVEPHWHTNAGELIYIVKGSTKITVLSPDGKIEELEVKGGEGAFAPASHFHNIENIGAEDVEVIAFFSHAEPDYIGFGEVLGTYSNEMLASIFHVEPGYFENLKKPSGPLAIIPT